MDLNESQKYTIHLKGRHVTIIKKSTDFLRAYSNSVFSLSASWSWEKILARNSSKLESKWGSSFLSCDQSFFTSLSLKGGKKGEILVTCRGFQASTAANISGTVCHKSSTISLSRAWVLFYVMGFLYSIWGLPINWPQWNLSSRRLRMGDLGPIALLQSFKLYIYDFFRGKKI